MNDDEHHGDNLISRMGKVERRAIPESWEGEILAAAFPKEPERSNVVAWWLPPRWLGAGLAACWLGIAVLRVAAPVDADRPLAKGGPQPSIDLSERQQWLVFLDLE